MKDIPHIHQDKQLDTQKELFLQHQTPTALHSAQLSPFTAQMMLLDPGPLLYHLPLNHRGPTQGLLVERDYPQNEVRNYVITFHISLFCWMVDA